MPIGQERLSRLYAFATHDYISGAIQTQLRRGLFRSSTQRNSSDR